MYYSLNDKIICKIITVIFFLITFKLYAQSSENCFLEDFRPKKARIPEAVDAVKPEDHASINITIKGDTLSKISNYVFGNAIAAWAGGGYTNSTIVNNTEILAPTLIRFPGGSWGDIYFWNGIPSDVPDSLYDGQTYNGTSADKAKVTWITGKDSWPTTPDQYYDFRDKVYAEGLITVNYGYARYGLSDDPVATAAHLAADWVRYDEGRTKFWEIGNESGGPWEAGYYIDTTTNKDGQQALISGELYGKHFKVFVDSMKAAAEEIESTIYIGGQVIHFDASTSWNAPDRKWNEGFFQEVGDKADFYVMHNYFSSSNNINDIFNTAVSEPKKNIDFIRQDIIDKNAVSKPVAITEYNMGEGSVERAASYVNGVQSVILISEMIKNNFSMAARWLLITGEGGMFYDGSDTDYLYHPHAEFYYLTYLQKYFGDHFISSSSTNSNVLSYASKFSTGETGIIVVNTGTINHVVSIDANAIGVGDKYYIYSFTAGPDNSKFSQFVEINGYGADTNQWGPFDELDDIPANAYTVGSEIKFNSPARSIQMILIEGGNNVVAVDETNTITNNYSLNQNYPNPFNPSTVISYQLPGKGFVSLKVFDVLGREVNTLVNDFRNAGKYSIQFNAENLSSGTYFYQFRTGNFIETKKMLLIK